MHVQSISSQIPAEDHSQESSEALSTPNVPTQGHGECLSETPVVSRFSEEELRGRRTGAHQEAEPRGLGQGEDRLRACKAQTELRDGLPGLAQSTDWFVSAYEKSPKPAHQLFIHYVEKRLDMEIQKDLSSGRNTKVKNVTKKSPEMLAAEVSSWDEMSEPDPTQEFEIHGVSKINQMEDQVNSLQQNQNMAQRMTQVEMALQEVLQHVRGLSVKTET